MSEIDLKKKYLRRANHLIQRDRRSTKRKLVEPLGGARSKAERERGGWERGDSCSDSDSMSRRSSSSQLESQLSPPHDFKSGVPLPNTPVRPFHHSRSSLPSSLSVPPLRPSHKLTSSKTCQSTGEVDVAELESQLQTQREVNRELKRLLVASVGSDFELRLEQIVQEKAELSQDLSLSLQQVVSNSEELDQVSIECDIWRSKFIASRVMIDELASWKAELSLQLRESHKALQYMLHEREDIGHELVESKTHLQRALMEVERLRLRTHSNHLVGASNVAAVSPVQYGTSGTSDCVDATVLELAHSNTVASRDLVSQLCRVTAGKPEDPNWRVGGSVLNVMKPTAGERLAQRVVNYTDSSKRSNRETTPPLPKLLLTDEDLFHHRPSVATGVSSSLSPLSRRLLHFGARTLEDPFRLPFHCSKCRGKILVV